LDTIKLIKVRGEGADDSDVKRRVSDPHTPTPTGLSFATHTKEVQKRPLIVIGRTEGFVENIWILFVFSRRAKGSVKRYEIRFQSTELLRISQEYYRAFHHIVSI
jgi:hypothetical protein